MFDICNWYKKCNSNLSLILMENIPNFIYSKKDNLYCFNNTFIIWPAARFGTLALLHLVLITVAIVFEQQDHGASSLNALVLSDHQRKFMHCL